MIFSCLSHSQNPSHYSLRFDSSACAESLPNMVSISLPLVPDSKFCSSKTAMKIKVTTTQACKFIVDSIIWQISHYVPWSMSLWCSGPVTLIYSTIAYSQYGFLTKQMDNECGTIKTPASFVNFWGWVLIKLPMMLLWKIMVSILLGVCWLFSREVVFLTYNSSLCHPIQQGTGRSFWYYNWPVGTSWI